MTVYDGLKFEPKNDSEWILIGVDRDMTTVKIPESFDGRKVTKINDCAFMNNRIIEAIHIPKAINSIGKSAFENCINLKYFFIENGYEVTIIGAKAFYKCKMLTSITCLKPVVIGDYAFAECANLRTIDGCFYEIHAKAFYNCQMLHNVNLQSRVIILSDAFMDCCRLDNIYVAKDVRKNFKFLDLLSVDTIVHCTPNSNLANLAYEGYKIVADLK